jgi:hypothetical protein
VNEYYDASAAVAVNRVLRHLVKAHEWTAVSREAKRLAMIADSLVDEAKREAEAEQREREEMARPLTRDANKILEWMRREATATPYTQSAIAKFAVVHNRNVSTVLAEFSRAGIVESQRVGKGDLGYTLVDGAPEVVRFNGDGELVQDAVATDRPKAQHAFGKFGGQP